MVKERIDAKNAFENYLFSMKNTIEDPEKAGKKITDDDKETIKEALADAKEWLEENGSADKEEFEEQLSELKSICDPIIGKIYKDSKESSYSDEDANYDLWEILFVM